MVVLRFGRRAGDELGAVSGVSLDDFDGGTGRAGVRAVEDVLDAVIHAPLEEAVEIVHKRGVAAFDGVDYRSSIPRTAENARRIVPDESKHEKHCIATLTKEAWRPAKQNKNQKPLGVKGRDIQRDAQNGKTYQNCVVMLLNSVIGFSPPSLPIFTNARVGRDGGNATAGDWNRSWGEGALSRAQNQKTKQL